MLLLALGLRAGAAVAVQLYLNRVDSDFVIAGDAAGYLELGRKLAAREEYSAHNPPRRLMRMPGFPALLAVAVRLDSDRPLPMARALIVLCGTATCGVVCWLGALLFDLRVGLIAGVLAAISPTLIGLSAIVLTETPFALTLTLSLIPLAMLSRDWKPGSVEPNSRRPMFRVAASAGLAITLACFVRPSWLLVAPGFCAIHCVVTFLKDRRHLISAVIESAVLCAVTVLAFAPWTMRNAQVTGHFVPTTLWVGPSLYDGLNPEATGDSNMQFFERDQLLQQMSEYEMDREYRRRAIDFVKENPGRSVALGFAKLWRFWKPWPNASQFQSIWLCLGVAVFFVPMIGFAILGGWCGRRGFRNSDSSRDRKSLRVLCDNCDLRVLLLTAGPVVYFSGIHAIFVGSLRYRLPAEYPLLVLSAVGLLAVWDQWRERKRDVS